MQNNAKFLTFWAILALLTLALPACGGGGEDCSVGSEGCPCTAGGSCDSALTCLSNLCVNPTPEEELCEEICGYAGQCRVAEGDNRDPAEIYDGCMYNCTRDTHGCWGSCGGVASSCSRARLPFPYHSTVDDDQCGEACECYGECRE